MCGIFGYVGTREADVALMTHRALRDLEYRGYDSWGIAVMTPDGVFVRKSVGKISDTNERELKGISGKLAIGHSRWATHGGVSEVNSHPHFNRDKTIAVIHNGIVENHNELRAFLLSKLGLKHAELFVSETDTEVIPHLIDYFLTKEGKNFEQAFVAAGKMLEGRYAVAVMKKDEPYLLAMRDGSPLVVGVGEDDYYLASDVPAFLDHTRTVCYPGDRQYLKVFADSMMMRSLESGEKVDPKWVEIVWDKASATKEGHPHYMLKEILEQSLALDKAIRQEDGKLLEMAKLMKEAEHCFFIGCGTAAKMAKLGELYAASIGGKQTTAFVGSEFQPYEQFLDKKSVLFAVSQSGETADVLEALSVGKKRGTKIISLLNVVGSSMDRMSDHKLFINTGPEIAVASTKAATAQIAVLILLAHALAKNGKEKLAEGKHHLRKVVKEIKAWLTPELSHEVKKVAEKLKNSNDLYIIGRGLNAPIAHEAAIKIQEVSYIHAEGFPGGELKHGPIALIQKGTPVIALIANDETKRDMESNTAELKSRGAYVIGIAPAHSPLFDEWIQVPDLGTASPIANLIPIQLLAYHLAVLRGNDPDKPRNLAKSVTVK
ncbi:MAG: glutamine--fructose-6-phosphate transaminase (isomerizing) [bacterium]|nr:glutamine--fructose-6-phosphate transaminase (isomerizing) [bacterium]